MEQLGDHHGKYLTRRELVYRLPISQDIGEVWPRIRKERLRTAQKLPLFTWDGSAFRWVLTDAIVMRSERIIGAECGQHRFHADMDEAARSALVREALYTSLLDGAVMTEKEAYELLDSGRAPENRSEQMVRNSYDAMVYAFERRESPITAKTIFDIRALLMRNLLELEGERSIAAPFIQRSADEAPLCQYRGEGVPAMMVALAHFIQNEDITPIIKASVAHFYYIYVNPKSEESGRTARILACMILLQAGYGSVISESVSEAIAAEQAGYVRAIADVCDDAPDMTYFIEYYISILDSCSRSAENAPCGKRRLAHILDGLREAGMSDRLILGAKWLLTGKRRSVTIKEWQDKYRVAMETARQDLFRLEEAGLLTRRTVGRRFEFRIIR